MKRILPDEIVNAEIDAVYQAYIDDAISMDEVIAALSEMYHPTVGKTPNECSHSEMTELVRWHNERFEAVIQKAQDRVRGQQEAV